MILKWFTIEPAFNSPHSIWIARKFGDGHLSHLEPVAHHPQGGPGTPAAGCINLWRILICCNQNTNKLNHGTRNYSNQN